MRIDGSGEHSTPLADLRQGDCIRVLPGERIAADGCIASGVAAIDEQLVTGEAVRSSSNLATRCMAAH